MKTIYAIFDRKTSSCALCKEAANIEEFERWFATVFLRDSSMFALYPQDYDIYSLCSFDDENMTIPEPWYCRDFWLYGRSAGEKFTDAESSY